MYSLLIVDDEKMIRMGIKAVLSRSDLDLSQIFTASSAGEALEILRKDRPQIMVTDIQMRGITGLELIEKARELVPELRVIVVTGYDYFEYARESLRLHVQNLFLKPIDEEDLIEEVQKQILYLQETFEKQEDPNQWRALGSVRQLRLEECIRNLLHNGEKRGECLRMLEEEFHFPLKKKLVIVLVEPMLKMEMNKEQVWLERMTIKNVCMGLIDAYGKGITFSDTDEGISLVCFQQEDEEDALEVVEELSDILKDELDKPPRFAIGSIADGFGSLVISYNDARYLLDQQKDSIREIIQTMGDRNKASIFNDIFTELKSMMCYNIGDTEYVLKAFDTFVKATASYNLSSQTVRRYCHEIASSLYFTCAEIREEELGGKLEALSKALLSAGREDACEVTRMFILQLLSSDKENEDDTVLAVKRYIQEHLAEDISVREIADHLYITPNYLSRLFKKCTGEGCNEYIIRKRIEKAKSLLETTSLRTGKIALMVGYRDMNYFSLAFKKQTGKSPTKYREDFLGKDWKV